MTSARAEPAARRAKNCAGCGRAFAWRRKWARCWNQVRFCSGRCRSRRRTSRDVSLERRILGLLRGRARGATICPSEAARAERPDEWRAIMESARAAARRLVARGLLEITQRGRVVDPSTARGPIRLRLFQR